MNKIDEITIGEALKKKRVKALKFKANAFEHPNQNGLCCAVVRDSYSTIAVSQWRASCKEAMHDCAEQIYERMGVPVRVELGQIVCNTLRSPKGSVKPVTYPKRKYAKTGKRER